MVLTKVLLTTLAFAFKGDRLAGAVVRVGSSDTPTRNKACGSPITASEAKPRGATIQRSCPGGLTGRYLSVDIPRRTYLQLCEVKILATCKGELAT